MWVAGGTITTGIPLVQAPVMDPSDKLRNLLLQLEEITKCPVCLEQLPSDIAQCVSGHGICNPCRKKLSICPACKQRFLPTKPTLLIQVLEVLPRLCEFADKGCKEISYSTNQSTHELFCEYRSFKCPVSTPHHCPWEGTIRNFKAHFMCKHGSLFTSYLIGRSKKLYHKHFRSNWLQQEYLHVVDNNLFLVTAFKDRPRRCFLQSVRHVPVGRPRDTYYFVLTISKKDLVYKHSINAVMYDECERVDLSPHCMVVPLDEMNSLLNPDGSLEVSFEILKKKNQ